MAFKLRSGNKPPFKMIGSSPMKQNDDDKLLKYSDLDKDQVEAAKLYNMSTYGTHNPTAEAKKRGMTRDEKGFYPELAKFHKSNQEFLEESKERIRNQKKGRLKRSLSPETILSYGDGSGPDDVARAKKRASQRYHGLSDERIRQILKRDFNKATKRAAKIKKMREEGTNPNKT